MKSLVRIIFVITLAIPIALAGAALLALEDEARVNRAAEFTPENLARARDILSRNDPRNMKPGTTRQISMTEDDLDLAVNYLTYRVANGSAQVRVKDGLMTVNLSAQLPTNPVGRFLNISAALTESDDLPRFERVRIGQLRVPAWITDWLVKKAMARAWGHEDDGSRPDVIKKMSLAEGRIDVTYQWEPDITEKARAVLLSRDNQERLRIYHEYLAAVTRSLADRNVSLTQLLVPLFRLAQSRSLEEDPAAENRAALFALTLYVVGVDMSFFVPAARGWVRPLTRQVTLNSRNDLSKHFMVSAALAAGGGGPLADAIGLYKEIEDSRGGSGFSFADIAADRAGTRFGEFATAGPLSAKKLQDQLNMGVRERDLMPDTSDLPEFMQESEFKRRFGGVGAPAYQQMMQLIERRVASLTLYQ